MRPRRGRPPVEHCFGVRPRKAAKWRADLNSVALATVATIADGGNTADPRDGGETPAGFIAAVPGSDRLFDLLDPFLEIAELIGHRPHGDPCFRQDAPVGIIFDDGDQLGNPPDTFSLFVTNRRFAAWTVNPFSGR